jgi:hypothetical protein
MDRVKKLHVDPHVPRGREAAMPDAWSLVQRLARCARTEEDTRPTEELIGEARRWLAADDHKELVRSSGLLGLCDVLHHYVVSGGRRCIFGSDQVQNAPGAMSRPRKKNVVASF